METIIYSNFIPLDLAHKFYKRWDCEIQVKEKENIYYKCLEGKGQVQFHNGNVYIGDIFDGLLHGKGTFKWANGLIYQGEFNHNHITGKGKYMWPDGSKYQGELKDGKRHGYGEYYSAKDRAKYVGTWQNGMKHGHGVIQYDSSAYYDGNFNFGKRQGWGKMHYSTGNQYQGQWVNDLKEGKGTMNWFNVNQRYIGNWKKDQPNGIGDYYWFDCKVQFKIVKNIYKGKWLNGKRQGYGAFYYSNGCKFQGYFKNNLKEGFGLFMNQMGDIKVDYFKHDKAISTLAKQLPLIMVESHRQQKMVTKLPQITRNKKQHKINNSNLSNMSQISQIIISEPTQNQYFKYIDFNQPQVNLQVYNLLLRNNSQLRNWYKIIGIGSIGTKDYYTGMTIQNFWKIIKDIKLNNDYLSLARLNRQFLKGSKSKFEIELPNQNRIEIQQKFKDIINSNNYGQLQFINLSNQINQLKFNWDSWKINGNFSQISHLEKNKIHDSRRIILYRHFICLLVHVALLQRNQNTHISQDNLVRIHIQILLRVFQTVLQQNHAQKVQSTDNITFVSVASMRANVAEWSIKLNRQLLEAININRPQLLGKQDYTVSVRTLYSILQKNGYFKDGVEKMLFLEKIQRQMNTKVVLFRKDMKHHYPIMEKMVLTSPYYAHIMNYEMIQREFDQIMYQAINRKMIGLSPQELQAKYSEAINNLIKYVRASTNRQEMCYQKIQMLRKPSNKDKIRQQLYNECQENIRREKENIRLKLERQREEVQKKYMEREDKDIINLEQESQSDQYFD